MKNYRFFYLITLICLSALLGCKSDDEMLIPINPPNPNDTTDVPDPTRIYERETHTIGDWSIEISVPSDYDSTLKYPVIYFNDGELFADIFGYLTNLDVPAFIMVGISGSNSRAERFLAYEDPAITADLGAYTPKASEYSDAIENEIMPFVEARYQIISNKKAFFGISLGGLHATWMGINYYGVFDFIGALSPSYWVANEALFQEDLSSLDPPGLAPPTKIYFDRGSEEWRNHLSFITQLKSAGLVYGKSLFYYEIPGAGHTAEDWQLRIDIPFKIFMEGVDQSEEPEQLELLTYCSNDLSNNNENTTRLNPIIHYDNGISFSVMSEATFNVIQGMGSVDVDGTYNISSGSSMTVEAYYLGKTDFEIVTGCN